MCSSCTLHSLFCLFLLISVLHSRGSCQMSASFGGACLRPAHLGKVNCPPGPLEALGPYASSGLPPWARASPRCPEGDGSRNSSCCSRRFLPLLILSTPNPPPPPPPEIPGAANSRAFGGFCGIRQVDFQLRSLRAMTWMS